MARLIVIALFLVALAAGSAGVAYAKSNPPTTEGAGAVYDVTRDDESAGQFVIARLHDEIAMGPNGSHRPGQWYRAEWTRDGVAIASESLHVAADGIYRHRIEPSQARATVTVDGEAHEQLIRHRETIRFAGPSSLCGFIDPLGDAPGCDGAFHAHLDGWENDGRFLVMDDAIWPLRVEDGDTVYQRVLDGSAEAPYAPLMKAVSMPRAEPLQRDGPHDTITSWPLQSALAEAQSDLIYSDLADFWAGHPDAIVSAAAFGQRIDEGQRFEQWRLAVSDGTATLALEATRATRLAPEGMPQLQALFDGVHEITFETVPNEVTFPTPAQRPAALAHLFGAQLTWQGLRDGDAANAFGFTIACEPACGSSQLWVGHLETASNRPEPVIVCTNCVIGDLHDQDTATFDEQGHIVGLDRVEDHFLVDGEIQAAEAARTAESLVIGPAGAVAIVGLVGLLVMLLKAPLAGLFSRVHGDQALENDGRREIVELVTATPGLHRNEIVRATGKGNGTVEHHLRTLVRTGHLQEKRAEGFACYFPRGVDRHVMAASSVLKAPLARSIVQAVTGEPGLSGAEVSRRTGADTSTVTYHLQRLEAAGLIERRRVGRAVQAYPQPLAGQAMALFT